MAIEYIKICRIDKSLRSYQQEAKSAIFSAWDKVDNVMFQMPTGTGKTRLFTSLINDINRWSVENKTPIRILIIAHRKELIDQIDESLQRYHVAHGIIAGGRTKERNLRLPVQVASIQTLTHPANKQVMRQLKVDFVIVDEAHHSMARTYQLLWHHLWYKNAKKLGVTATPWRMNHSGFTKLYEQLIRSKSIQWFMDHKYLAPYEYYSIKDNSSTQKAILSINEFDVEGDYKVSAMEQVIDTGRIRAKLLSSYQRLAAGKKGIIYSISRAHSEHICKEYSAAGIRIANIDSQTPKQEREAVVNSFKKGDLDVIVNVDIFSEGFDCPDIEFIQLARPTKSLVKYLQQVGRGLRPTQTNAACIIIDNVGVYNTFGLPNANRQWIRHFKGNPNAVIDESPSVKNKGLGTPRELHIYEGDEDMVLIQQISPDKSISPLCNLDGNNKEEQPIKEHVTKSKGKRVSYKELKVNDAVTSPRYGVGRVVRFSGSDIEVHFQDGTHTRFRYPSCFVSIHGKAPFLRMNMYELANEADFPENHHKRWDEEEEYKLINLFEEGCSTAEIAEILKRSEIGILMRLDKLGLIKYKFEG